MSERRKILREAIYLAHEGGYDGPGSDWDSAPAAELDQLLATGAYVPVLRAERFSRPLFWHILFPAFSTLPSGSEPDPDAGIDMEEREAEIKHLCDALARAEDPLDFLKEYLA